MLRLPETDPMPINELAGALNKNVATIYRWGSARGIRGRRLRLTRIGGRTYVYHSDWEAFEKALNKDQVPESRAQPRTRHQVGGLIDAELDAAGL
jgi:predicted transcriptional regulator